MEEGQIVKLNIGGIKFSTSLSTLSKSDYFTFLMSDNSHLVKDKEGNIFIDRNGSYFEPILHYLRTGVWQIPKGMDEDYIQREAAFYLIEVPKTVSITKETKWNIKQNGVYLVYKMEPGAFGYFTYIDFAFFRNKNQVATPNGLVSYEMDDSGLIQIQNRIAQLTSQGQIHWKQKNTSNFAPSEFFPSIKPKGNIIFKLASFSVGKTNLSCVEISQNKISVDIRHFFSATKFVLGVVDEVFLSKEGLWTLEVEITQQEETFQLSLWFFASCCIACINGYYDVFHVFA